MSKAGKFLKFLESIDKDRLLRYLRDLVLAGRSNEVEIYDFLVQNRDKLKDFLVMKHVKAARIHSYFVRREDIVEYIQDGKVKIRYPWPCSYFKYSTNKEFLEILSRVVVSGAGFLYGKDEYGNVKKSSSGIGFVVSFRPSDVDVALDLEKLSNYLGRGEGSWFKEIVMFSKNDYVSFSSRDIFGVIVKDSASGTIFYSNEAISAGIVPDWIDVKSIEKLASHGFPSHKIWIT